MNMMMAMATPESSDMDNDYQFPLPGFRFHPTDEELVGFYLRRKVENKTVCIELIRQLDIYKYNPWDLPHTSSTAGEKELYFYCKRGRKYKNSVRPNRVTGSGFWKATGIDKPIYKHGHGGSQIQTQTSHGHHYCIGLKKTLVYYRGSAGRGIKTEWMMNEFRLPNSNPNIDPFAKNNNLEEAEVWTLCRIFKRSVFSRSNKVLTPNWREIIPASAKTRLVEKTTNLKTNMDDHNYNEESNCNYISFSSSYSFNGFDEIKKKTKLEFENSTESDQDQFTRSLSLSSSNNSIQLAAANPDLIINNNYNSSSSNVSPANSSSFSDFDDDGTDLFGYEKWEELKSIMEF